MNIYRKCFYISLVIVFTITAYAKNISLVDEVKNKDGSVWVVEKYDTGYSVKYTNRQGREYVNNKIIPTDIEGNNLFLDATSSGIVSLVMDYPRDDYILTFSSGETPFLVSACKRITLSSSDQQQAVELLSLCSKNIVSEKIYLSDTDTDNLFLSENLTLNGSVKTIITSDKAFLFNENGKQKKKNPT